MVYYSINSNARYIVYIAVFFGCLALDYLIKHPVVAVGLNASYLQFVTLPGLITATVFVVEKFGWKWFRRVGYSVMPDFSGTWYGYIKNRESFRKAAEPDLYERVVEPEIPVKLDIEQNFSLMGVWLSARSGTSRCTLAGIEGDYSVAPTLRYMFAVGALAGETSLALLSEGDTRYLDGRYSSNQLRRADLRLRRTARKDSVLVTVQLEELGREGRPYVGAKLDEGHLARFDRRFRKAVGRQRYRLYSEARFARDRDRHHVTVIDPAELEGIGAAAAARLVGRPLWLELVELGTQARGDHQSYYVIVLSDEVQRCRRELGLPHKDLHVTLGFKGNDLHDVPKGRATALARA